MKIDLNELFQDLKDQIIFQYMEMVKRLYNIDENSFSGQTALLLRTTPLTMKMIWKDAIT